MKFHIPIFTRAEKAAEFLIETLKSEGMITEDYKKADYIIAVGDRQEMFDFVLERFRENKDIIHLWAGEIAMGDHDEVYRHAMTLMSNLQLCTNEKARQRVLKLCNAIDKKSNAYVIGNLMLDDMRTDETLIPNNPYVLILYNPPDILTFRDIELDLADIQNFIKKSESEYIWIEPNRSKFADIIIPFVTHKTLERRKFLGLLKNCQYFLTNSSSQYFEAPHFLNKNQIVSVGERNKERESKYANMNIKNATRNIIKILKTLK